jgi:hypothetical protein
MELPTPYDVLKPFIEKGIHLEIVVGTDKIETGKAVRFHDDIHGATCVELDNGSSWKVWAIRSIVFPAQNYSYEYKNIRATEG